MSADIPVTPPAVPATAAASPAPAGDPYRSPPPVRAPKRRSGWSLFFIAMAGALAALVIGFILFWMFLFGLIAAASAGEDTGLGANTVLSLDLRSGFADHSTGGFLGIEAPSVVSTVRKLDAASRDDKVEGLFIRAGGGMSPAAASEIGRAVSEFRDAGKFVVGFAQGFESASPTGYSAISDSELWMQASTAFFVSGYRSESEHYKGLIEMAGADEDFYQFYEYKTAADTFNDDGMTEPAREATTALLDSLYGSALGRIADARGMDEGAVRALFEASPHTAEEAKSAGLIDELGHLEDARQRARDLAGDEDADFVSVHDYELPSRAGKPLIAFIGGQGAVVTGESTDGTNPFSRGATTMGSDTVAGAFEDAVDNDNVRAIVFRVSSPGGSPAASDQIHAAVARAKEAGKPVVVSMGAYAASGGYYVSANADHIVAEPTTITGSIGVLGGKISIGGALDKVGVTIDHVDVGGPFTGAFSADTPFSDYQGEAWREHLENTYVDFTTLVAEGRDLPLERVLEVAKGRVWTGEQALELGLVDELGGVQAAIAAAKRLAEIDEDTRVRLRRYPDDLSTEEQLLRLFSSVSAASDDVAELSALLNSPEARALIRASEDLSPGARAELRARLPRLD